MVSVPYEITLLSNSRYRIANAKDVSVPYEITLLSNTRYKCFGKLIVSVPYEITLLSNLPLITLPSEACFSTL